jgi:hypothetical protein
MGTEILDSLVSAGYAPWRIPGSRDGEIDSLISEVSSVDDYVALNSRLTIGSARILTAYSVRCASRAVRVRESLPIRCGLIAVLLATGVEDDREILIPLSLLFRATELIHADPLAVFDDVSRLVGEKAKGLAYSYVHRSPADRSISAMGFMEGRDDDGFRFRSAF